MLLPVLRVPVEGTVANTWIMGRISASPRTAVDLAVPFSPRMRTPERVGLMMVRMRPVFILSCPTMATKG